MTFKTVKEPEMDKRIEFRLPYEEWLEWKCAADALSMSVAEYIRANVRNGKVEFTIKNEVAIPEIKDLLAEYGKIGSNINQIAHYLNEGAPWSRDMLVYLKRQLLCMELAHHELMNTVRRFNGDHKTHSKPKLAL